MTIAIIIILLLVCIGLLVMHPAINLRFMLLLIRPFRPFDLKKASDPPDYSNADHWAALPFKENATQQVPSELLSKADFEEKPVDVFYLHRTTLFSKIRWNAALDNRALNKRTIKEAIRNQASIFNESCNIYVPRYRQATLYSFFDKTGSGKSALDLAYGDVKNAFRYYLDHYNQGKPIIIAAHSQGAEHATQLLRDFFDEKELKGKLVIAYLVGMPIQKDTFSEINLSEIEDQTGCYVSWSTFGRGIKPNYFQDEYKTAVCTNPLTWNSKEEYGDHRRHLGSVPPNFKGTDKHMIDARCSNGVLWITNRKVLKYMPLPLKNYVVMDFDLFYMNIRENVKQRINSYINSKDKIK
jgi:hypothetical protein